MSLRSFNDNPTAAQGVMALIDGRQLYNPFLGNPLWDQMPIIVEDLEKIDIIRGPGSYIYGPDAMHGLVHFKTKSPLEYEGDRVSLSTAFGSYESNISRLLYVKQDDDTQAGLKATFVWDDINQFQPSDENTRDKLYGDFRFEKDLSGGASSGSGEKSTHLLEVSGGASKQKFDLLLPSLGVVPPDSYSNEAQEVFLKGNYTHDAFKAQVSWTGFDSSSESENGIYEPFDLDLDTLDLDIRHEFELLSDHLLTVGTGYRYSTFETEDTDVGDGRHSTNLVWAFLQDEVKLADTLTFVAGLRIDHQSVAGTNVSPRAALVWGFDDFQTLRASIGTGFRYPSLREQWFVLPVGGTGMILGNEDLKAEELRSAEVSYLGTPLEDLTIGATGFYNVIDNLIEVQPVSDPPPVFSYGNSPEEQEAYGTELEAAYLFNESVSGFGNWSYQVRQDRETGVRKSFAPLNKANLGARFKNPDVMASLWVTYFDDTEFAGGLADEYTLLNGSFSYFFPLGDAEGRAFLEGFNLTDTDHREHPEGDEIGLILQIGLEVTW